MEGQLLAQIDSSGNIVYVHSDYVNNPQKITNPSRTLVWDRIQEPFGEDSSTPTNTTPTNHRFPGQYFDAENSLNYNNFRDYDRSIGRYIESDPMGLAAGPNLFGYASQNPTQRTDRRGLDDLEQTPQERDQAAALNLAWNMMLAAELEAYNAVSALVNSLKSTEDNQSNCPCKSGTTDLYHGTPNNYSDIQNNGLDPNHSNGVSYVTPDPNAAQNAADRDVWPASENSGVVKSTVSTKELQDLLDSGDMVCRNWNGFGGGLPDTPEYQLSTPDAYDLFNKGIVK